MLIPFFGRGFTALSILISIAGGTFAAQGGRAIPEFVPRRGFDDLAIPGAARTKPRETIIGGERITPPEDLFFDFPAKDDESLNTRYLSVQRALLRVSSQPAEPFAGRPPKAETRTPSSDAIRAQVERDYINAEFAKRGLSLRKWRSSLRDNDFESRFRFIKSLDLAVPGGRPEIITFFDRTVFKEPIKAMTEALGRELSELPLVSTDSYFAAIPQRIVIVVGHVERGEFVLSDVRDNIGGKHDIVDLMRVAEQYNVLLIPVGCRTASGGAPIGSTRNISTDDIVSMLKSLRQHETLVSDVFRSLETIGDIQINFNWTGRAIEMVVTDSSTGLPKLQFRVPGNITLESGNTQDWDSELVNYRGTEADIVLKETNRIYVGIIGKIELLIVDHPFVAWLFSWGTPILYSIVSGILSHMAWLRLDRRRAYLIRFFRISGIWAFIIGATVFIISITIWSNGVFLWIIIASMVFGIPIYFLQIAFDRAKRRFGRERN